MRRTKTDFEAELAGARSEAFGEAILLIRKLIDSGLSLRVAEMALAERSTQLHDEHNALLSAAAAKRKPPKPKLAQDEAPA
jgi:hypothetical protein